VEVTDFSQSSPDDRHFVCDTSEGEIQFGPGIKQPNGEVRQYGSIPPSGTLIRMSSYRHGGGSVGNVGKNTLTVLKTSIPYVASVTNRRAASGGTDPETVENAMLRGPQMFRTRNRAVTEGDFEVLAMECSPSIARAKCVQPRDSSSGDGPPPGVVLVLLIPSIAAEVRRIPPEQLELSPELRKEAQAYLDERRLLTSLLVVSEPTYYWVSVDAKVRIKAKFDPAQVRAEIDDELYRFINPLIGGPDGNGWPFGRALTVSDVYSRVQSVEGVEYVEEAKIQTVDMATGQREGATQRLELPRTGVLCSHEHSIALIQD
jgi:predicted phage baseplate assembly protein